MMLALVLLPMSATALGGFARTAPPFATSSIVPELAGGGHLQLAVPGTRVGDRVWPAAGSLCAYVERHAAVAGKNVLELGCGTGAVGIFAAASGAAHVEMTDGANVELARRNALVNRRHTCDIAVNEYWWGGFFEPAAGCVDVVLGSDVTYDSDAHEPLLDALEELLAGGATALLAHQHRRLQSVLDRESSLYRFAAAAKSRGFDVASAHVDRSDALAPVEILEVKLSPDAQLAGLLDAFPL